MRTGAATPGTRDRVMACRRALLRRGALAALLLGVGAVGLVLPMAFFLGDAEGWTPGSALPLVLLLGGALLGGLLALGVAVGVWRMARLDPLLETMEGSAGLPRGRLRAQLELEGAGGGPPLVARGAELLHPSLDRSPAELAGDPGRRARKLHAWGMGLAGAVAGLAVLLLLASPERSLATWAGLAHPLAVLNPEPLPPLVVEPGDVELLRGDSVELRVQAPGRREVTLREVSVGTLPRSRVLPVEEGVARGWTGAVQARTRYRVEGDDGFLSPEYLLEPRDPLLLEDFRLELRFPPWTGMDPEIRNHLPERIAIPQGTRLVLTGRLADPGAELALVEVGEGSAQASPGTLATFRPMEGGLEAAWTPPRSTRVRWALQGDGLPSGDPRLAPVLEVEVVPDLPPRVTLSGPPQGAELPASGRLALLLEAEDDWGVGWVELQVEVHAGGASPRLLQDRTPAGGAPRVALAPILETAAWGAPGGTRIRVRALAADEGAGPGIGETPWIEYRLPGSEALRSEAREEVRSTARSVEELAERAAREQARAEEALRDAVASGAASGAPADPGGAGANPSAGADVSTPMAGLREALEGQAALLSELDALRAALSRGGEGLGRGQADDALRQLLDGLDRAFEAMAGGEGRARLEEELGEALQGLAAMEAGTSPLAPEDQAALLARAAERADELRERLEGLRAELREAAFRSDLTGVRDETATLAREQERLAQALDEARRDPTVPSPPGAGEPPSRSDPGGEEGRQAALEAQRELERRAAELRETLERLQAAAAEREQTEPGVEAALEVATRAMEEAGAAMTRTSEAMAGGSPPGSDEVHSAREAAEATERARAAVEEAAGGEEEARGALFRDVLSGIALQALGLGSQARELPADASRVAAVSALREGTLGLAREAQAFSPLLGDAARRVVRELGMALAALEGEGSGEMGPRVQGALQGVARAALEAAAHGPEGMGEGGAGEEARSLAEALDELAAAQDALNQDAAGAAGGQLPQPGTGDPDSSLEARQEAVAAALGNLAREPGADRIPGSLEELAREAEELARALENVGGGERPPAEVLDRQARLLERLLDAGRSLEREGPTEERQGTPALPVLDRPFVPALPPEFLGGARIPLPGAEALQGLTPGERRLVLEYLRRLAQDGTRVPGGEGG